MDMVSKVGKPFHRNPSYQTGPENSVFTIPDPITTLNYGFWCYVYARSIERGQAGPPRLR